MKKLFCLLAVLGVLVSSVAMAADAVVPAATTPSLMAWFQANTAVILGVALAISELLAQIPAFKGNGILDTIIKALQALSEKPQPPSA